MKRTQVDCALEAAGLVQAARIYIYDHEQGQLRAWVQKPRRYQDLMAVCLVLSSLVAQSTDDETLDGVVLELMGGN